MPSLTTLAIIVAGGLVLYLTIRAGLAALEQSGRDAERAERAQHDLELAEAQGEVMAESRTVSDAEQRLREGKF